MFFLVKTSHRVRYKAFVVCLAQGKYSGGCWRVLHHVCGAALKRGDIFHAHSRLSWGVVPVSLSLFPVQQWSDEADFSAFPGCHWRTDLEFKIPKEYSYSAIR